MTARSASTHGDSTPKHKPLVQNPVDPMAWRVVLTTELASGLADRGEIRLAKVVLRDREAEKQGKTPDVTVAGFIPDEFGLDLPSRMRYVAFRAHGIDWVPCDQWAASRVQGYPLSIPLSEVKGFQWIDDEDAEKYLAAMIHEDPQ